MITQQRIMELFSYDETTGIFIRKCDISKYKQGTTANKKYGFSDSHGRLQEMAA